MEKPVTQEPSEYLSYMLRLWRASSDAGPGPGRKGMVWRASLQDTLTDERISFTNLEDLVAFLRRKMEVDLDTTESEAHRKAK